MKTFMKLCKLFEDSERNIGSKFYVILTNTDKQDKSILLFMDLEVSGSSYKIKEFTFKYDMHSNYIKSLEQQKLNSVKHKNILTDKFDSARIDDIKNNYQIAEMFGNTELIPIGGNIADKGTYTFDPILVVDRASFDRQLSKVFDVTKFNNK